jgi:streptogramin lyase
MMKNSVTLPATPARAGFQLHLWWFIALLVVALPLWTVIQAWSMLIPPSDCNQSGDTTHAGAVVRFCLPSLSLQYGQGNMTIGPDGNLWFVEMNKIGRITPTGKLREFPVQLVTSPIASGPDGNLWFVEMAPHGEFALVRMSPNGNIKEFWSSLISGPPTPLTVGPDGNLWVASMLSVGDSGGDVGSTILKITPTGEITSFSLPPPSQTLRGALLGSGVIDLTSGADGNIWFLENVALADPPTIQGMLLGSITPSGTIKQFPVEVDRGSFPPSQGGSLKGAIAAGPDGNLWFMQHDGQIGRITPSGMITRFQVPGQTAQELPIITKGPDGNLWFSAPPGKIGRITPNGIGKLLPLPAQTQVGGLAAAPDGHIWFLNAAETWTGPVWWVHIGRLTV